MAERVGFEPTWDLRPQRISSPRRYVHFGTSPVPGQGTLCILVYRFVELDAAQSNSTSDTRSPTIVRLIAVIHMKIPLFEKTAFLFDYADNVRISK